MPTVTYTIDAVLNEDHTGDFPNPFPQRPPDGTFEAVSVIFTGRIGELPAAPAKITGHHVRFSTGDAVPLFTGADKFLFQTPFWNTDPLLGGPLVIFLVIPEGSFAPGYEAAAYAGIWDPDSTISTLEYTAGGDTAFGTGTVVPDGDFPGLVDGTLYGYHQPPTHWHGEFSFSWEYPEPPEGGGLVLDAMDLAGAVI